MQFTNTGTLTTWQIGEKTVIPQIHTNDKGQTRGGAFLCLPNFESLPDIFQIKHGEYRITPCEEALPHHKILEGEHDTSWGSITTEVNWQEQLTATGAILTTSVTLQSLTETSTLRPGFHPYFSVTNSWSINVGDQTVTDTTYTLDTLTVIPATPGKHATLLCDGYTINISASIQDASSTSHTVSYCIWSDNPTKYICIEPVLGGAFDITNLPTPYSINRGETTTLAYITELVRN